jgi:ABC-2 type transport system ATP-binding protein
MREIVRVEQLSKTYGSVRAVDGLDLTIHEGEIFGMVGPNGAGKTTAIECIEGLRRQDRGLVRVLDLDPQSERGELYERIGMQLQSSSLDPHIRVAEALDLFSSFYQHPAPWRELLDLLGLEDKKNTAFSRLSGGQKQRLLICLALINDPEVVFLDELTTGLDPQARRATWDLVHGIRERGKTVFLTTHFMEEAENLCDRVAVIDHGKIIALGTPRELVEQYANEARIEMPRPSDSIVERLQRMAGVQLVETREDRVLVACSRRATGDILRMLTGEDVSLAQMQIRQANLEDVFLALTGKEMRD